MTRNDFRAFHKAEARDDALHGIYTSHTLDETPLILVLLQKTDSLPKTNGKLVIHRRLERVRYSHEPGEFPVTFAR